MAVIDTNSNCANKIAVLQAHSVTAVGRYYTTYHPSYQILRPEAQAIVAAGRVSLCAQDEQPPYKYVTVEGLFDDPHLVAVNFFRRHRHPTEGELLQVPTPIIVDGAVAGVGTPVRHLGEDGHDALDSDLGRLEEDAAKDCACGKCARQENGNL